MRGQEVDDSLTTEWKKFRQRFVTAIWFEKKYFSQGRVVSDSPEKQTITRKLKGFSNRSDLQTCCSSTIFSSR